MCLSLAAGFQVVLLLAPEHRPLARAALKLARLWVRNIVDRLHVVLIMGSQDSKDAARAVLDEVGCCCFGGDGSHKRVTIEYCSVANCPRFFANWKRARGGGGRGARESWGDRIRCLCCAAAHCGLVRLWIYAWSAVCMLRVMSRPLTILRPTTALPTTPGFVPAPDFPACHKSGSQSHWVEELMSCRALKNGFHGRHDSKTVSKTVFMPPRR